MCSLILSIFPGLGHSAQTTLSWQAPATNEDGTPLTDLAGCKVYYGTVSRNYTQSSDVGEATSYT
ncbi:MAG: hypothetical protein AB1442_11250, partial [Nitrospirota bacterium]